MKIREAILKASCILEDSMSPRLDAEVILGYCIKKDKLYLYTNLEAYLTFEQENEYFELITRRSQGEPVQYITGKQEFMALDFTVKRGVLIPRPDTEILVERALEEIRKLQQPVIADVGCGSGAIAVSLAAYKRDAFVYALDIMDTPLEVTRINAEANGVADRVSIIKSDLLEGISSELKGRLDVVISNPPYIKDCVIPTLMREVRDYEPVSALSGGDDGLHFYRRIVKDSLEVLKPDGILAFEIGYDQAKAVEELLKMSGYYAVECIRDLANRDRVILARRK